jgi:predicted transcriptional regulator
MSKSESPPPADRPIETAEQAANHALVLAFGRLQGAASRLGYLLGGAIEKEFGITHLMYEVLLILGRSGETRLIDRMEAAGLVRREDDPNDRRGRQVRLTERGEDLAVRISRAHVENIRRFFLEPLPEEDREAFMENLRILSHSARDALPRLR